MIYLDAADDFLAKARRFYPPKGSDDEEEETGLAINLPLLLARLAQARGEEDDVDGEEGSGQDEPDYNGRD